jgi:beta-lactamase class A
MEHGMPEGLAQRCQDLLADFPGRVGLAAYDFRQARALAWHAETSFPAASTIKLGVLVTLMRATDQKLLALDELVHVPLREPVGGSGILRHLRGPLFLTWWDLATLMVVMSDNVATNLIIDRLGLAAVNEALEDLGLTRTRLYRRLSDAPAGPLAEATPDELCRLMRAVVEERAASPASCRAMLDMLGRQQDRTLIPRYLPFDPYLPGPYHIANKTGFISGVRADVAYVEGPGARYVLAVMVDGAPDPGFAVEHQAAALIGHLAKAVHEVLAD